MADSSNMHTFDTHTDGYTGFALGFVFSSPLGLDGSRISSPIQCCSSPTFCTGKICCVNVHVPMDVAVPFFSRPRPEFLRHFLLRDAVNANPEL